MRAGWEKRVGSPCIRSQKSKEPPATVLGTGQAVLFMGADILEICGGGIGANTAVLAGKTVDLFNFFRAQLELKCLKV